MTIDQLRSFIRIQRQAGMQTVAWVRYQESPTRWADEMADAMVFYRLIEQSDRSDARAMLMEEVRDISLLIDERVCSVLNREAEQENLLAMAQARLDATAQSRNSLHDADER